MLAVLLRGVWDPCTSLNKWLRTTDAVQYPHFLGEVEAREGQELSQGETAN